MILNIAEFMPRSNEAVKKKSKKIAVAPDLLPSDANGSGASLTLAEV